MAMAAVATLVRARIWNERRTDTIEEFLGPESVGHLPAGEMIGVEPFKQLHAEFLAAFPDLRIEVEAIISEGDDVVVRWRAAGTHDGDGFGFDATHQSVLRGNHLVRIKDGKFVEGWDRWNQEALGICGSGEGSNEQRDSDPHTAEPGSPPASGAVTGGALRQTRRPRGMRGD